MCANLLTELSQFSLGADKLELVSNGQVPARDLAQLSARGLVTLTSEEHYEDARLHWLPIEADGSLGTLSDVTAPDGADWLIKGTQLQGEELRVAYCAEDDLPLTRFISGGTVARGRHSGR